MIVQDTLIKAMIRLRKTYTVVVDDTYATLLDTRPWAVVYDDETDVTTVNIAPVGHTQNGVHAPAGDVWGWLMRFHTGTLFVFPYNLDRETRDYFVIIKTDEGYTSPIDVHSDGLQQGIRKDLAQIINDTRLPARRLAGAAV